MREKVLEDLKKFFENEKRVEVVYLFGSHARGLDTVASDVDLAVLLSEVPENFLDYYLYLVNRLSEFFGDRLDLVVLNIMPPMFKYQVIKYGEIVFCRDNRFRVMFESRALCEYLDFRRVLEVYDRCLVERVLA